VGIISCSGSRCKADTNEFGGKVTRCLAVGVRAPGRFHYDVTNDVNKFKSFGEFASHATRTATRLRISTIKL
jgi:hypothetical protein